MAVNSSTTTTVQDENGPDIVSSVKVWVGPKVKSVNVTERMIAPAGKNEVALEGKCLENAMKVGLFDASGKLIDEKDTKGNAGTQKATLDVPSNIGGKADVTYTVKYATDQIVEAEQINSLLYVKPGGNLQEPGEEDLVEVKLPK